MVEARPTGPKYHPLVIVLIAVCAGVLADRGWGLPLGLWWTASAMLLAGWFMIVRHRWTRTAGVVLLGSVSAVAAGWHHGHWSLYPDREVGCFAQRRAGPVCVEAVAAGTPQRVPAPPPDPMRAVPQVDRTQVELRLVAIRDGPVWASASGRARLTVEGHLLGVHVGDRLRVFAQLAAIPPPENPGAFDHATYARIERRRCRLWAEYPDCVTVIVRGRGGPRRWLETVRARADRQLEQNLSADRYGLAAALLLGIREELGSEGIDPYVETGSVHILSISGLHVGIVAATILLLMRGLMVRQRRALLVVAVATTLYTLLTGAQPPAIRALILVLLMCWSNRLNRPSLPLNSLAAAALVVLAINPAHLFSIGVQLSFLGVVGLMVCSPRWFGSEKSEDRLEQLIQESQGWTARCLRGAGRFVGRLTLVGGVIWALTLPLVMARFHLFQPGALVLNTLLWPLIPVALVSGFGVIGFGWLLPPLAWVFRWSGDLALGLIQGLVALVRETPGSHIWVPGPADWWLAGLYGGLGVLLAAPFLRPPRRWCAALLAAWTAVGFVPHFLATDRNTLEATFLSVGHGCAVVLRLPNGATMLYDAGSFVSPQASTDTIADCLWSKGITHLDAVVLSHADADHYNALPGLLRRFSVGAVYVSPMMFENSEERALAALDEAIRRAHVPLEEVYAGDRLRVGAECRMEVLHPPRRGVLGGDNPNSIVLAIDYLGQRILLPGDLDSPGLQDVLAEEPWDCHVLLAPHHGSRQSDQPGLAAWCRPEWVVISGGSRWDVQATLAGYQAAGAEVLHTAEVGAVTAVATERGIRVRAAGRE